MCNAFMGTNRKFDIVTNISKLNTIYPGIYEKACYFIFWKSLHADLIKWAFFLACVKSVMFCGNKAVSIKFGSCGRGSSTII